MKLELRDDGWWVIATAPPDEFGPYDTKAEANDDRRGLERFKKENPDLNV